MGELRRPIVRVAKMITDDLDIKLGKKKMDESRPEYWMLDLILTDEMAEIVLKMGRRKPRTLKQLVKVMKWPVERVERVLKELCSYGVVEYNYHNANKEKQYVVPVFVVGMAENFMMNKRLLKEHPLEVAKFQDQMAYLPMVGLSHMIPPGGGGAGFHVIPIEKAIPKDSQALDIEHISYWLEKYKGQYAIMPCVCRRAMRIQGKGCGEMEENVCIALGDYATYMLETDKDVVPATYEEIVDLLRRTEENGYMHQITNGDGRNDVFAICNCTIGSCYGLRCSQLFNQPNASASAYRAEVDTEKCVACGKCVEACPAGAPRLGQKLCTKEGPVVYPKQPIPDDTKDWGRQYWNENYRDDSQINCYDSGTAPCKTACPAHIAIQGYIKLAKQGKYREALELIKLDNPFPAVCGSICNRRCEDACTRGSVDEPIAIDEIKKYIAHQELNEKDRLIPKKIRHRGPDEDYTEKIAVVGAGPGGMSCAYFLANMGYPVTVFEKGDKPGGMLVNGIPNFRLEKDVLNSEIEVLKEMGVTFKCGVEVGKDVTLGELREEGYKGFCIAIGAQGGRRLGVPGEDAADCMSGIEFLRQVQSEDKPDFRGEKTIVIGGGNVAIDVARSAVRTNGTGIEMFCLESREQVPASFEEIEEAEKEGIVINYGWGPKEIIQAGDGKVQAVIFKKCVSVFDETGRFDPRYDEQNLKTVECSHVLVSIGQSIEWNHLLDGEAVELNRNNTAVADKLTNQTRQEDIFVCGDVLTGPRFAIDAIAGGREAAISLHRYVHEGHSLTLARNRREFVELDKEKALIPLESFDAPKRQEVMHDEGKSYSFHDDRIVFTREQVEKEASRCLGCGATYVDQNKCIGCGLCTTKCRFDAIHLVRNHPEFADYVDADEGVKRILKHGITRNIKLKINGLKGK